MSKDRIQRARLHFPDDVLWALLNSAEFVFNH